MLKSFNRSIKNRKPLLVLSFENMNLKYDKLKIYKLDNYENDAYDFCINFLYFLIIWLKIWLLKGKIQKNFKTLQMIII